AAIDDDRVGVSRRRRGLAGERRPAHDLVAGRRDHLVVDAAVERRLVMDAENAHCCEAIRSAAPRTMLAPYRGPLQDQSAMRVRRLVAATTAAAGLVALTQASASSGAEGVPHFGHVFVIIGENTDYQHLTTTNAPYLMTAIRPASAWFDNYYAATHWSQANYVALTSGQFTACEQKDLGYACRDDVDNLFHQLDQANMSW